MIDIPNLIAGAVLGFLLSLPFFIHERHERKREVGITWTKDMRRAERLLADPEAKAQDVYDYFSNIPTDHYRRVLGPDDFRMVEDLQNAFWGVEHNIAEARKAGIAARPDIRESSKRRPGESPRDAIQRYKLAVDKALNESDAYQLAWANYAHAQQRLDSLRVAVMNRGRERSREEYGDLIRREQRADRLRHPIRWLTVEFRNWRRRRRAAKENRAERAPRQ